MVIFTLCHTFETIKGLIWFCRGTPTAVTEGNLPESHGLTHCHFCILAPLYNVNV
jgi:hypothetical protein